MKKHNVLVAEDDAGLRALLEHILRTGGYEPIICEDGKLAWDRVQKGGIDLVVLDVNMPNMDGIEVCKRIRRNDSLRHLPIILLTVRALAEDQLKGFGGGADDYLTKPFEGPVLLARLRVLERRLLGA